MRPSASTILVLSSALLPLITVIAYYGAVPFAVLVLVVGLSVAATAIAIRVDWLSYLLSISAAAILATYLNNIVSVSVLLYAVFSSLAGIRSHTPVPKYSTRILLPGILVAILTITYSSILIYALSNTNIEGLKELGLSSQGAAIIYGFAALFASPVTYGYYSGYRLVPREALVTRKLLNTLTPDNGFRLALYLASLAPSITYHEPFYAAATLIAYVIKLFTPSSRRLRNLDILVYAIVYFALLKLFEVR